MSHDVFHAGPGFLDPAQPRSGGEQFPAKSPAIENLGIADTGARLFFIGGGFDVRFRHPLVDERGEELRGMRGVDPLGGVDVN